MNSPKYNQKFPFFDAPPCRRGASLKVAKDYFGYTMAMYTGVVGIILFLFVALIGYGSYAKVRDMINNRFTEFGGEQERRLEQLRIDTATTLARTIEDTDRRINHL